MGQLTRNEVFTLAVQRYSDTVYRTAVHNCRCTADAEDVVQDVFEKLLHYNGIFESEEHLKAWLLRAAIPLHHFYKKTAIFTKIIRRKALACHLIKNKCV